MNHDVLVRIRMAGICGSDVHYYTLGRIGSKAVQFPFIIGHEAVGVIEATGKEVTREQPGQSIAIDPAPSCGRSDPCLASRENTCRSLLFRSAPCQMLDIIFECTGNPEAIGRAINLLEPGGILVLVGIVAQGEERFTNAPSEYSRD